MHATTASCCGPKTLASEVLPEPINPKIIFAKKITRIVLALFGFCVSPFYFSLSFGIGSLVGLGYIVRKIILKEPVQAGKENPQCGRGWIEDLSGIQSPPLLSIYATAIFIAGHMQHSPFYVMFCGTPIGFYFGMQAGIIATDLTKYVYEKVGSRRSCCC